jgi:hypothetical protein
LSHRPSKAPARIAASCICSSDESSPASNMQISP